MNQEEQNYLNLLSNIIDNGSERSDRTGVGTKSIFGAQLRFSLNDNTFPLLTTKKMFTRGIIEELLFFIRGETNSKKLEEKGVNIWKGNTSREFLDKRGLVNYPEGEMGPMYGFNWRKFGENLELGIKGTDQLQDAVDLIKKDPFSRRIMVTAYNPSESHKTVLDPCHIFYQFYVDNGKLSLMWTQRSCDTYLGLGFNLSSYALLTILIAKICELEPGEVIFSGGDVHLYNTHIEQAKEQISREPYQFPKLFLNKEISSLEDIEKLCFEDFSIEGYNHHPALKAPMAV